MNTLYTSLIIIISIKIYSKIGIKFLIIEIAYIQMEYAKMKKMTACHLICPNCGAHLDCSDKGSFW